MKRFLKYWLPPLAWMGVIYYMSAQPSLPSAPEAWMDLVIKKAGHALAYGVLAWLYLRALRESVSNTDLLHAVSWGLALAYALSDEYHQTFVPGRNGSWIDATIDALGAGGAMLLAWWRRRRAAQQRENRRSTIGQF